MDDEIKEFLKLIQAFAIGKKHDYKIEFSGTVDSGMDVLCINKDPSCRDWKICVEYDNDGEINCLITRKLNLAS